MPKRTNVARSEAEYSPDFKLTVVLEYIRNPKQRKRVCRKNQISEELLTKWYQQFNERANQIFSSPIPPTQQVETPSANKLSSVTPVVENPVSETKQKWGVRLNHDWRSSLQSPSSSKEPPAWLRGLLNKDWEIERGLVVWDDASQKMEVLRAESALELLQKLRISDDWKSEGIAIKVRFRRHILTEQPTPKRSRKKQVQDAPPASAPQSKPTYEDVEEERLRLPAEAGAEVFAFLQEHEALLKEMAEEDEKKANEAFLGAWQILFRSAHEQEATKIDFSARPLQWMHDAVLNTWVCDSAPNRGTVKIDERGWFWESSIEQPDHFKRSGPAFVKMEEALAWTEQELLAIQKAASEETEPTEPSPPLKPRMDLTPYQIDPASLEPERITYRVFIELEHEPEGFKAMEMSFGKMFRYDEDYPTPKQVGRELQIDSVEATVEWPGRIENKWYFINSTAVYFQEPVAAAQAQRLWDQSTLKRLHAAGKIKRARYGIEEVETGFVTWLGAFENPEDPLPKPKTRAEHMANWAMRETLTHALDVDGYRERTGIRQNILSDDDLLAMLHERRAESVHIPESARAESRRWLEENPRKKSKRVD